MEWNLLFFVNSAMLGVGLAMDAFSVSLANGLNEPKMKKGRMCTIAGVFAGFQALMPLIGFFFGRLFAVYIEAADHWVAFILLVLIGANMLKEAFSGEAECDCCCEKNADYSFKTMLTMAIATSIDALAVGVSLSLAGDVNIWLAISLIGVTTCILSAIGVKVGSVFGSKFESKAQAAGGIILIFIGIKILLEHLGVLNF